MPCWPSQFLEFLQFVTLCQILILGAAYEIISHQTNFIAAIKHCNSIYCGKKIGFGLLLAVNSTTARNHNKVML